MTTLLLFAIDSLILFAAFRGLSTARAGLPATLRAALGFSHSPLFVALATLWFECGRWALPLVAAAGAVGSIGLRGDGLARLGEAMGRSRFALYLLSVTTLTGLVYLFVPITTFLTSPGELGIHLDYLLSVNLRDAMVIVYAAAALYGLLPSARMKTALTLMAMAALGLAMVYSNALPFGYPMMTGLMFEQLPVRPSARTLRVVVDLALVVAVGLALRWALLRFGPTSSSAC